MPDGPTPRSQHVPIGTGGRVAVAFETLVAYTKVRRWSRSMPLPAALSCVREIEPVALGRQHTNDPWALAKMVVRVLRLVPSDTRCLMTSLTLLALMKRRGIEADLVIGVLESGEFEGHAWVEYQGHALLPALQADRRLTVL